MTNEPAAQSLFSRFERVVQRYFDGLWEGDVEKLAATFHPRAQLFWRTDGEVRILTLEEWLAIVAARPKPCTLGYPRTDRLVSLDLTAGEVGVAKVECSIHPRYFVDYLTLLTVEDGEPRIVAKAYHPEIRQAGPTS